MIVADSGDQSPDFTERNALLDDNNTKRPSCQASSDFLKAPPGFHQLCSVRNGVIIRRVSCRPWLKSMTSMTLWIGAPQGGQWVG